MVTDKKGMSTVNITPDDEVADVGALYQIAPKRAWAPTRRSKTKATAFIAEKAPQLGSDDSSEDEDFAPKFVPLEDEDQSVGGDDGPLEAATTNGDSDDEGAPSIAESEAVHNEEWGTYRRFNRDEYIGPKKPDLLVIERKLSRKKEPSKHSKYLPNGRHVKKRSSDGPKKNYGQRRRKRKLGPLMKCSGRGGNTT